MNDVFITGLKRAIVRREKLNEKQLTITKPTQPDTTEEVSDDLDEAYRIKIITQTINYINKQKETLNDRS
ncbi:hypothetical protein KSS93_21205 [Pseudomonas xanthosomatis]|uniref:hypothetical protein n=1 Tax=Pseudomonas xanthosomatis TaxID=2842356 RepID=UPI001C3DA22E|nr:hypothetical protein [Pseudomonas xanthosomatis]QXH45373.1 hypothetical protein KSS93_21205 [Pseudomonas xanthosomatis]